MWRVLRRHNAEEHAAGITRLLIRRAVNTQTDTVLKTVRTYLEAVEALTHYMGNGDPHLRKRPLHRTGYGLVGCLVGGGDE